MKRFQQWLGVLLVALAWQVRAADPVPTLPFSGKVVDSQGRPVADADVICYQYSGEMAILSSEKPTESHTNTDSQGAFTFLSTENVSSVVAKKSGLAAAWKTRLGNAGSSAEPLVLTAPVVLAGVVMDENGAPVEGAEVWVSMATDKEEVAMAVQPNILFGKAARDSFSARTGADGHFRIENFPSGAQANLDAAKKGKTLRGGGNDLSAGFAGGLNYHSGKTDIKLVVESAGSIEGKVVAQETGQGLAGVKLRLQSAGPGFRLGGGDGAAPILSGADGSFRIPDMAVGSYKVTAVFEGKPMPDWVAESDAVTVAAGENARDVRVHAQKGGVVMVTVVSTMDQKPVSEVNVAAFNNSGQTQASGSNTGANGVAFLRLMPGTWNFNASKRGWSSSQQNAATVENGQTNQVEIDLTPPLVVKGTVRDPAGAPVAGAAVAIGPNYGGLSEATTDANGHYELNWGKQNYGQNPQYSITARSVEKKLAAIHDIDEATTNLDLKLQAGVALAAQVEDAKGKPITNATARVVLFSGNTAFPMDARSAQPDEQGRVRFEALPQGQKYSISIAAKGYGSTSAQVEATDTQTAHYDFPTVVLPLANRKLAGKVLGADGKPADGVMVQLNGEGQPNGSAKTDANGHFMFDAVCDGPVNLFANAMNANGNTQTVGGDTNVIMRLRDYSQNVAAQQTGTKIKGLVTDASGAGVAGVRLMLYPNYWGGAEVKTDASGRYSMSVQNPQFIFQNNGNGWTPSIVARSLERNLAAAHDIDEKTTNLDLRLEDGLTVSVKVEDADHKPIKNATATMMLFSGMNSFQMGGDAARTDESGQAQIKALPRGQQFNVNIAASGYGSSSQALSPTETKASTFNCPTFVLRVADRKLAGQVFGIDGKPVIGANVNAQGEGQPNANTRTDAKGHFAFAAVCEGPISLNANYQGAGGVYLNANAQARGGDTNVTVRFTANNNMGGGTVVTTSGTVFDAKGAPAAGVSLVVASQNYYGNTPDVRSESDGKYSISWQFRPMQGGGRAGAAPPKPLLIGRDEEHNLAAIQEVDDKTTSMDLHLQTGLTLSGTVEDGAGARLTSAQIQMNIRSGGSAFLLPPPSQQQGVTVNVDSHGAFAIRGLPQGKQYDLYVSCAGHGSANKNVTAAETQTESLTLPVFTLKMADRQLEGKVVDAQDQPVAGAQVNFNGQGQPNGNTRSDSSGHFVFKVCDGPVTVFAYKQPMGGGQFIQGNVRAQGGDTNVVVKLGVNQPRQVGGVAQAPPRFTPLKPPPWSWAAISKWPGEHAKLMIVLLGVQMAALVATASGILWVALRRKA